MFFFKIGLKAFIKMNTPIQGLLWHHIANLLWAQTDLILAQVNKSTRGSENH